MVRFGLWLCLRFRWIEFRFKECLGLRIESVFGLWFGLEGVG